MPLTADLRRVHFNVGTHVVKKLEAAREGLSHSIRGATVEQVLEAALDLLLEKQAKARGLVKRPRAVAPARCPTPMAIAKGSGDGTATAAPGANEARLEAGAEPVHRRDGPRPAIPAAVRRAVWQRDAGRCSWPLDSGGCCGSTHRLELDHIDPWARWGPPTEENLRVVCRAHNNLAARQAFGERMVGRYGGRRAGGLG